jgi:hypothetical protein
MNYVRMYLLYKRKINAKECHKATKPLKKGVTQLREKRNQKRYQLLDADHSPCCGSGMFIPDPGSEFVHPGSRLKDQNDSGSASKNLVLTQTIVSKLSEI